MLPSSHAMVPAVGVQSSLDGFLLPPSSMCRLTTLR
jgi:hypothetical protein